MFSSSLCEIFSPCVGQKRMEWCKFGCSRDNTGSFILIFSKSVCLLLGTAIPYMYEIGIFKKWPYKKIHVDTFFREISCEVGILVCP